MTEMSALAALILAQVMALQGVVSISVALTTMLLAWRSSLVGSLVTIVVVA